MAKWNWPDKEADVTPRDLKEAWDKIDALGEEAPTTVRDALIEIIRKDAGVIYSGAVDAILATYAVIPKEPTDGLEVDVPGWVVSQIEADIRADLNAFIERASKLAFDSAARDTAMYLKGWNECVEAVKRKEDVDTIVDEPEGFPIPGWLVDQIEEHHQAEETDEPEEDIDEAMRQADA
jgi:hypothetical protein